MFIKNRINFILGLFLFIFSFSPVFADELPVPIGTLLYRSSPGGLIFGYNTNSLLTPLGKSTWLNSGHVGIYVGENEVLEANEGVVRVILAERFANLKTGEKFIGAKIPKEFDPHNKIIVAELKNLYQPLIDKKYDGLFHRQKGPGDGDWICVGLTEKLYESLDKSDDPKLIYLNSDPICQSANKPANIVCKDKYGIDITPDGFDSPNNYKNSSCFSLSKENLALPQNWDNASPNCFSKTKEFSYVKEVSSLGHPLGDFMGRKDGKGIGPYIFMPASQFYSDKLKDVEVDSAWFSSEFEPTANFLGSAASALGDISMRIVTGFVKTENALINVVQNGAQVIVNAVNYVKEKIIGSSGQGQLQLAQTIDLNQPQTPPAGSISQNSGQNQNINSGQPENKNNQGTGQENPVKQQPPAAQQPAPLNCAFGVNQSPSHENLIINEVAWMGGLSGANDEWIELKNISNVPLDISGYQLVDKNGKIKIVFENGSKISGGGFYLLERVDDNTVPGIPADVIYSGTLTNTNDGLRLFDSQCNLIDEALANPDWPAGDNVAKKTMERGLDLSWYASSIIGGTPKKENSQPLPAKQELIQKDNLILDSTSTQILTSTSTSASASTSVSLTNNSSSVCSFNTNQPAQRQGVIINEVAWMGTTNSANDEWIELKNISGAAINITGWQLLNKDEKIKIKFDNNSQIPAIGFFLLERTDDDTVPGIKADKIYTGALANTDEGLRLFDGQCNLIDEVLANTDWPAGDNAWKNTMERDSSAFGWHTSSVVGGTPKKENSSPLVFYGGGGGGGSAPNNQPQTNNNSQQSPAKILISEIQITGGPGKTENDFIELYNPNTSSVNLNGYRLVKRTKTGTSDTGIKSWTIDTFIPANSYYLWANSDYVDISVLPNATTSAAISNDNGVAIRFGSEDTGAIIDSVGWGEVQNIFVEGQAFNINPGANQSLQRKFQNNTFVDTGNNAQDFEIQNCPSPKAQSKNCPVANRAPSAFFIYTPPNPRVGDSITFNAASSSDLDGYIKSYQWDFGDNTTSTVSAATTTHSFSIAGAYKVQLTAFDNQNTSSTATSTAVSVVSAGANHLVISEIYPDKTGNNFDFVELYNPTDSSISLGDYSLKIIKEEATSTNPLSNFPASQTINARSFFLIGLSNYSQGTSTVADVFRPSYSLLTTKPATIVLYDKSDSVDEFNYNPANLLAGQSFERKGFYNNRCVSAQGDGKFLGNGCDTDSADDFEIRQTPNPQNFFSFPEPRSAPAVPANFAIQYSSSTMKLICNWGASQDYNGATSTIIYKITDISDTSSTLSTIEAISTSTEISISEISRDYIFSMQVFDKEGLGSATSTVSITVPSLFSGLYFYRDPRDLSKNLIEAYYNKYPFIPDLYYGPPDSSWKLLVFYLNSDTGKQSVIDTWPYQPNKLENVLPVKYKHCSGGYVTQENSLLLPDIASRCGTEGGAQNITFDFTQLEDNHFIIQAAGSSYTNQDYLTVALYSANYVNTGPVPYFRLVAVDKNKYFFGNPPIHRLPQLTGQININFERQNSQLHLNWPSATDADTLDSLLTYEIQYASSSDWSSVGNNVVRTVAPGDNFSISVKAKDDFGNYSTSTLTGSWSYPETTFYINQSASNNWINFGNMDGNDNIGVSLQSISSASTSQFNIALLKIKRIKDIADPANLKLSIYNNGANNRPNFSSLIGASVIPNIDGNPENHDLTFYFSNPIIFNAGNKYWLALEVAGYPYSSNSYYPFTANIWQNAVSDGSPYSEGEAGRTVINRSVYNNDINIISGSDWYMKIGYIK